ncbi:MAG: T9SS type A sorting domain-containing protein [Prolixibacteraceae bacterium]|nr:T9SS type A sorting domain-containing protein [Prolixibacteraceae bacterium]
MKHFALLLSLFLSVAAYAQWSTDPKANTPIGDISFAQDGPSIVSDGSGGTIISWSDSHNDGSTIVQRYNATGLPQWKSGGISLSTDAFMFPNMVAHSVRSISDGTGGAFIVWQGRDSSIPGVLTTDVYAQHINSNGLIMWQSGGIPVCKATNGQTDIQIIGDGSGGALISWTDSRDGIDKIYAQHINQGGNILWTANGLKISPSIGIQNYSRMVSDGSGGALFVWQDIQGGLSGTHNIAAQRINGMGEKLWNTNGIIICKFYSESPCIAVDGKGGAYIIWQDVDRSGRAVYAQHINSNGEAQWTADGIPIGFNAQSRQIPLLIDDNAGGAILAFHGGDQKGYYHVYLQRINSSGIPQWTTNIDTYSKCVNICPEPVNPGGYAGYISQLAYSIEKDGSGGAVIGFVNMNETTGPYKDIYAQRINANGVLQWTTHGVAVCTATNHQTDPVLATDAAGNTVLAWDDLRNNQTKYNVYIQQVSKNGILGTITTGLDKIQSDVNSQIIQNYPNPFSHKTTIQYAISNKQPVLLKIYDILGNEIATLVNEEKPRGKYTVNFDATNISNGIYIVKLLSGNTTYSKKMIYER